MIFFKNCSVLPTKFNQGGVNVYSDHDGVDSWVGWMGLGEYENTIHSKVTTKILRRFYAFLGHNRFLASKARFIALPLCNRLFN